MIASLKGIVESVGEDGAVIETGGVGYLVFCSSRTLSALPGVGEAVALKIETHVREDHIHLFGFADYRIPIGPLEGNLSVRAGKMA